MSDFFNIRKVKKSRKEHTCVYCNRTIDKGTSYTYAFGIFEGETQNQHWCNRCMYMWDNAKSLGFDIEYGEFSDEDFYEHVSNAYMNIVEICKCGSNDFDFEMRNNKSIFVGWCLHCGEEQVFNIEFDKED